LALPAWLAVIEQLPTATSVIVFPATVQTAGVVDAKLTGSPELAVAVSVMGVALKPVLPRGANAIVCEA
jgi:hypothetical protein